MHSAQQARNYFGVRIADTDIGYSAGAALWVSTVSWNFIALRWVNLSFVFKFYSNDTSEMEWPFLSEGTPQYSWPENSTWTRRSSLLHASSSLVEFPRFRRIGCSSSERWLLWLLTAVWTRQTCTTALKALVSCYDYSPTDCIHLWLSRHIPWIDSAGQDDPIQLLPCSLA